MEKIMTAENIRNFAYVNDAVCTKPIKGIAINFFGLGNGTMRNWDIDEGEMYGEHGILYVEPYNNPWAWMNKQAVSFVDEILDVLFEKFSLAEDTPIVSSGESMGGQSALTYCVYAKRTPVACVANCPVCDIPYHFTERNDLPRTMYSALWNYEGSLEAALQSVSPIHLIDKMPNIEYHIFHCGGDQAVNIARHSDIFVEKMRRQGHSVCYHISPNRGHCDIGYSKRRLFVQNIIDAVENTKK